VLRRFPYGSNLDEFQLLGHAADVRWSSDPRRFSGLDPDRDAIILPGSKHVVADLEWMRSRGIDQAILAAARHGVRVIGVCGGAMMLGARIADPDGIEGPAGSVVHGLGLMEHSTVFGSTKRTESVQVEAFGSTYQGYEIRFGELTDDVRFGVDGNVTVTTVHGLFEHPGFIESLLGVRVEPVLEPTLELLADAVEEHLDTTLLRTLVDRRVC
jgi:adenosylcobyric acid synthase